MLVYSPDAGGLETTFIPVDPQNDGVIVQANESNNSFSAAGPIRSTITKRRTAAYHSVRFRPTRSSGLTEVE